MSKYLFVYRMPQQEKQEQRSPEEMQQMMAQWHAWKEKFSEAILDLGDGLLPTGKILRASGVTDGPFVEAKELLGGYSIVEASDYNAALEVAQGCPMTYAPGFSIEIRELAGF